MPEYYTPLESTEAYRLGYFSFKEKIEEAENPYPFETLDYLEWRKGWYKAKKDTRPPIWRCPTFWSGLIFIVLGGTVIAFEIPVVQENPRYLGAGLATYGIGSILLKVISGQTQMQPVMIPPLPFKSRKPKSVNNKK